MSVIVRYNVGIQTAPNVITWRTIVVRGADDDPFSILEEIAAEDAAALVEASRTETDTTEGTITAPQVIQIGGIIHEPD